MHASLILLVAVKNNLSLVFYLREVMTFRGEVQKSPEVKFAMAVFHALNSNNFVRFFRLLRYEVPSPSLSTNFVEVQVIRCYQMLSCTCKPCKL